MWSTELQQKFPWSDVVWLKSLNFTKCSSSAHRKGSHVRCSNFTWYYMYISVIILKGILHTFIQPLLTFTPAYFYTDRKGFNRMCLLLKRKVYIYIRYCDTHYHIVTHNTWHVTPDIESPLSSMPLHTLLFTMLCGEDIKWGMLSREAMQLKSMTGNNLIFTCDYSTWPLY